MHRGHAESAGCGQGRQFGNAAFPAAEVGQDPQVHTGLHRLTVGAELLHHQDLAVGACHPRRRCWPSSPGASSTWNGRSTTSNGSATASTCTWASAATIPTTTLPVGTGHDRALPCRGVLRDGGSLLPDSLGW